MGLLAVVTLGMFSSCKDYDDDINANAEDIVALQNQLATLQDELESVQSAAATYASQDDLEALEAQIQNLVTATQLETAISEVQALIDGKVDQDDYDAAISELTTQINSINESLNTLTSSYGTLEETVAAAQKNIAAQDSALQVLKKTVEENNTSLTTKLGKKVDREEFLDSIAALREALKTMSAATGDAQSIQELKDSMKVLNNKVDAFGDRINLLTVLINKKLTSLVLKPDVYYGGIESVEILQDSLDKYTEDKSLTFFKINGTKVLSGVGVANYHVNPSTADLSGTTVGFYGNSATLKEPLTRAGEEIATPVYTKVDSLLAKDYFNAGILSVPFKANFDLINKNLAAGKGSFIAAQVSTSDTTVTSDYAMVVPTKYYNLLVADNSFTSGLHTDNVETPVSGHLHKKFSELSPADVAPTHEVVYDSCINISALLETHYMTTNVRLDSANVTTDDDKLMDDATFEALGLKYVVKTVNYTLGSNQTDETAHIELVTENGEVYAYPRDVDASGKTITSETASEASIGRMPMLVIEILDSDNEIVAYGYMKLKIVDKGAAPTTDKTATAFEFGDLYLDCDGTEGSLTWSWVEYNIYNKLLNMSKNKFDDTYQFDYKSQTTSTTSDGTTHYTRVGNQFVLKSDGTYAAATAADTIGTVTEEYNESESDATTHVLKWKFTSADYKKLAEVGAIDENGVNTKAITTYVRYKALDSLHVGNIYMPLTIPAGKFHFATASIADTKTLAQWYQYQSANNATSAEDAFEVRANVPVPTPSDNLLENTEFVKDLHDYFLKGQLSVALDDKVHFDSLAKEDLTPEFEFTTPVKGTNADFDAVNGQWTVKGYSGREYTLSLNNEKNRINVVKINGKTVGTTTIAKLTNDGDGIQSVLTYVEGNYADDILNYASHSELGSKETFTVYIKINSTKACYPLQLTSPYFNVRMLRPLNLTEAKPYEIIDAPNDVQLIKFTDLVGVTDWRDYTGDPTSSTDGKQVPEKLFDYEYYQVKFVADTLNVLTDANLGSDYRQASTEAEYLASCVNASNIVNLKLTQKDDSTLSYINNSGNTGTYHLFIPIKMTYVFGDYTGTYLDETYGDARQKVYAIITVKNTEGNAKKN